MRFIFKTSATMKDYNRDKWWIDRGIIGEKIIIADSTAEALDIYVKLVERDDYTTITKNAIKKKEAMYIDSESGEAEYKRQQVIQPAAYPERELRRIVCWLLIVSAEI